DAIHIVKVRVWLSEESGGYLNFTPNAPYAVLTRIIDPLAALTRPDSSKRMLEKYGAGALSEYMKTGQFPGGGPAPKGTGAASGGAKK
ncbi:MAG: hypothetical protein AABZ53_04320, partial [Planctomycetota bacterium]